jgi:hypothetical protein
MASIESKKQRKRLAMSKIRRVQAILRRWDPIGVLPGEFAPADEYDDYAPHIVSMLYQGCSVNALADHLSGLRIETIGLEDNPERDREIAIEIMEALREDGR